LLLGAKSYQDSLSVDASVHAGFQGLAWGGSFSASTGYQQVANDFFLLLICLDRLDKAR
jgi:hypothetical protein